MLAENLIRYFRKRNFNMLYIQFLFLLLILYMGSRYGGIGLGVVSGIGLVVEVFIFQMPPTSPPLR